MRHRLFKGGGGIDPAISKMTVGTNVQIGYLGNKHGRTFSLATPTQRSQLTVPYFQNNIEIAKLL
jgi:hypothetical protein